LKGRQSGSEALAALAPRPQAVESRPVALRVLGLSKTYGQTVAVKRLSFEIHEGEIFGLLGPNGAGKTTTIGMLATQQRPTSGDALLFGCSTHSDPYLARSMTGMSPQEIALYPKLTAAENLRFFGRLYGVAGVELEGRIGELLSLMELQGRRDDFVDTFSHGMKRRLNLAVALIHQPRLLLLDEPTAGVDPQSREHIFEVVRGLRDRGSAILYTTHYMEEAQVLCDRLGIMDRGELLAIGSLDALLAEFDCGETIEVRGLAPNTSLDALRSNPDLLLIEQRDGVLRLSVRNAASLIGPLQKLIGGAGPQVHLRISPPSLEHLFLHLTGGELRD
jgi:ABC-2 type transport system ATP-binding protein